MTNTFQRSVMVVAALSVLPACATVNVAEVAGPATARAEAPAEVNIIQRAVDKLKVAFTQRGFGPNTSKRKMNAAADMLLNGLSQTASADADGYNATAKSPAIVAADILVATRHVDQTTRAAEVYLEMAPRERKLAKELQNLEAALLASERAVRVFTTALDDEKTSELLRLRESVNGLRRVTDEFGIRVRMERSDKLALSNAAS